MQKRFLLILLICVSFVCLQSFVMENSTKNASTYKVEANSNSGETVLNHQTYKEKAKNYHFNPPRSQTPTSVARNTNWDFSWFKGTAKFILYGILFIILGVIIYFLVRLAITPGNKRIKSVEELITRHDDEPGIESDLEKLLKEALSSNNYRNAIRIYYLMSLRELTNKKLVTPAREKTNFEYLAELGNHSAFLPFREMTIAFERSWFGDGSVTEQSVNDYSGKYESLRTLLLSSSNPERS